MKFEKNKKYNTIALYACLIILFAVVCVAIILHISGVQSFFTTINTVLAPVIYGAVIAYILNPVMTFFERKVFITKAARAARKRAKNEATSNGVMNKYKLEKAMQLAADEEIQKAASEKASKSKKTKKSILQSILSKKKSTNKGRRGVSLLCTYLIFLLIILFLFWIILPQLLSSMTNLYNIVDDLPTTINSMRSEHAWFNNIYNYLADSDLFQKYGLTEIIAENMRETEEEENKENGEQNDNNDDLTESGEPTDEPVGEDQTENPGDTDVTDPESPGEQSKTSVISLIIHRLMNDSENLLEYVREIAGEVFVQIKNIIFGAVLSIYFLIYKDALCVQANNILNSLLPEKPGKYVKHVFVQFDRKFGQFMRGKILDSAIIGLITFIVLGIFRIPYFQMIALIIGITNIIPVFGPFIGAIPSALIIFLDDPAHFSKVILFVVIVIVIQQIDGNVIGPRILGSSIELSPLWVMIAILVMSGLFGVFGMFFGVPIFAVVYSLISEAVNRRLAVKKAAELTSKEENTDFIALIMNRRGNDSDRTHDDISGGTAS